MTKVAVLVLAGTESHESLGRVVNALELAKELQEHGTGLILPMNCIL